MMAYKMRNSDWSSDGCTSDLVGRRRRTCDRLGLDAVGIRIVKERTLRRRRIGPGVELGQVREGRQVVAAAGLDQLADVVGLRQVNQQANERTSRREPVSQ